ncbi:unnamed protein product [Rotaria sp. Silwood1]|nr:unnamed protein product [Rotaria sp. Silwood1]
MDSTTTASHNAERQGITGTPEQFVLGNRFPKTSTNTQQGQSSTNTGYKKTSSAKYNVELLKELANDFGYLLNRTDISDCWLNVNDTYMAVHQCVLAARSNTFSAIMSGNNSKLDPDIKKELQTLHKNDKLVIFIKKTDPEIMKQVIIFMYTAKCELNERNAFYLFDAAGRYDIKSLKVYTAQFLINHINRHNILRLIESAYIYNNILLKQSCIDYFIDHGREVMDVSELWKPFAEKYPAIVSELLYWTVHKDENRERVERSQLQSQW